MPRLLILTLIVAVSAAVSGCALTPRERAARDARAIDAIVKNSFATAMAGEAIAANDPDRVKPALAMLQTQEAGNATFFNALDGRLAKVEAFKTEAIGAVAAIAKTAVPSFAAGIGMIENQIQTATTSIAEVQSRQGAQEQSVQSNQTAIRDAQTQLAAVKVELDHKEKAMSELKDLLAGRIRDVQIQFASLDPKVKEEAKQAIVTELATRKLVSESELEKIRGMSSEEVIGLLGGGGAVAAAALAALMRTFGRSRSEPEIQKLREKLEGIAQTKENMAALQKELDELWEKQSGMAVAVSAAEGKPVTGAPPQGHWIPSVLAEYQARIAALEKSRT